MFVDLLCEGHSAYIEYLGIFCFVCKMLSVVGRSFESQSIVHTTQIFINERLANYKCRYLIPMAY